MLEGAAAAIPTTFVRADLTKWWRQPHYFKEFRSNRHPIFPDSDEVLGPNNKRMLRMWSEVRSVKQEERKAAEITLLAKLARYPSFLSFQGFTIRRVEGTDSYQVNMLLEFGGNSLNSELKKRQKRDNPIFTEEQLWEYLWHLSCSLVTLEALGIQRYGHMMYYSVRTIDGRLKLMFQPSMPRCLDLARQQIAEYYTYFLSPEELDVLRGQINESQLNLKSDLYSVGMMLLNMAAAVDFDSYCYLKVGSLKGGIDEPNFNQKIAYFANYYSKTLLVLLCDLLKEDPNQRPSVKEVNKRIEATIRKDLLKREKYLNMLASHHSDSQLTGVSYDLPADDETMKELLRRKKAEIAKKKTMKSSPYKAAEPKPIVYRGTFGQERKSPRGEDQYLVRSKVNAQITMLKHSSDEEEEIRQVPIPIASSRESMPLQEHQRRVPQFASASTQEESIQPVVEPEPKNTKTDSHPVNSFPTFSQLPPPPPPIFDKPIVPPSDLSISSRTTKDQIYKASTSIRQQEPPKHISAAQVIKSFEENIVLPREVVHPPEQKLSESPIFKRSNSLVNSPHSQDYADSPSLDTFSVREPQSSSPKRSRLSSSRIQLKSVDDLIKQFGVPGVLINGNCYYGPITNGRRNGKGLEIFPNNQYYYGGFENDLFHGEGFYFWSKIEYFKGTFYQGMKKEGLMVVDHRRYQGSFKNNKRHGMGKAYYGVQTYEGEWIDGRKHGEGTMWYEGGDVFKGRWERGIRSGKGVLQTRDMEIMGQWVNDQLNGYAQIIYSNGDIYRGEYHDSKKEGKGIYYFATGAKFEGLWSNNHTVRGKMVYADGSVYEGQLSSETKRHGKGIYKYGNGDIYDGEWQHGQKHGYGRMSTSQQTYEGGWQNNLQHGRGIFIDHLTGKQKNVRVQNNTLKEQI